MSPRSPSVPAVPDTTSASLGPTVWQFPMTAPPPAAPTSPRASHGGGAARGRRHLGEVGATPRGRGRAGRAAMLGAACAGITWGCAHARCAREGRDMSVQGTECDSAWVCKGCVCVTLHGYARQGVCPAVCSQSQVCCSAHPHCAHPHPLAHSPSQLCCTHRPCWACKAADPRSPPSHTHTGPPGLPHHHHHLYCAVGAAGPSPCPSPCPPGVPRPTRRSLPSQSARARRSSRPAGHGTRGPPWVK